MDTDIIEELKDEAEICRNEGDDFTANIAKLLDAAVAEIERLRKIEREMKALASMKPLEPGGLE